MKKLRNNLISLGIVGLSPFLAAEVNADSNPFTFNELPGGYMQSGKDDITNPYRNEIKIAEAKCGEAKCAARLSANKKIKKIDFCNGLEDAVKGVSSQFANLNNASISYLIDGYDECYIKKDPYYGKSTGSLIGVHYMCGTKNRSDFNRENLLMKWEQEHLNTVLKVQRCFPDQLYNKDTTFGAYNGTITRSKSIDQTSKLYSKDKKTVIWVSTKAALSPHYGVSFKIGVSSSDFGVSKNNPPQAQSRMCEEAKYSGMNIAPSINKICSN